MNFILFMLSSRKAVSRTRMVPSFDLPRVLWSADGRVFRAPAFCPQAVHPDALAMCLGLLKRSLDTKVGHKMPLQMEIFGVSCLRSAGHLKILSVRCSGQCWMCAPTSVASRALHLSWCLRAPLTEWKPRGSKSLCPDSGVGFRTR